MALEFNLLDYSKLFKLIDSYILILIHIAFMV